MIRVRGNVEGGMTMESVLTSIKKLLGISEEDTSFDVDLIMHINSVFSVLNQLGVGPPEGYAIQDKNNTWNEFITEDTKLNFVKSFMHLKVKLLFDPPLSSSVMESMKQMIGELEWRLSVAIDLRKDETGRE